MVQGMLHSHLTHFLSCWSHTASHPPYSHGHLLLTQPQPSGFEEVCQGQQQPERNGQHVRLALQQGSQGRC